MIDGLYQNLEEDQGLRSHLPSRILPTRERGREQAATSHDSALHLADETEWLGRYRSCPVLALANRPDTQSQPFNPFQTGSEAASDAEPLF